GIRDRNVTGVQTCALPIYPLTVGTPASQQFGYWYWGKVTLLFEIKKHFSYIGMKSNFEVSLSRSMLSINNQTPSTCFRKFLSFNVFFFQQYFSESTISFLFNLAANLAYSSCLKRRLTFTC